MKGKVCVTCLLLKPDIWYVPSYDLGWNSWDKSAPLKPQGSKPTPVRDLWEVWGGLGFGPGLFLRKKVRSVSAVKLKESSLASKKKILYLAGMFGVKCDSSIDDLKRQPALLTEWYPRGPWPWELLVLLNCHLSALLARCQLFRSMLAPTQETT